MWFLRLVLAAQREGYSAQSWTRNKMLYFYNNQYEGGVADKYTFCTGCPSGAADCAVMQYMIKTYGPRIYTLAA